MACIEAGTEGQTSPDLEELWSTLLSWLGPVGIVGWTAATVGTLLATVAAAVFSTEGGVLGVVPLALGLAFAYGGIGLLLRYRRASEFLREMYQHWLNGTWAMWVLLMALLLYFDSAPEVLPGDWIPANLVWAVGWTGVLGLFALIPFLSIRLLSTGWLEATLASAELDRMRYPRPHEIRFEAAVKVLVLRARPRGRDTGTDLDWSAPAQERVHARSAGGGAPDSDRLPAPRRPRRWTR